MTKLQGNSPKSQKIGEAKPRPRPFQTQKIQLLPRSALDQPDYLLPLSQLKHHLNSLSIQQFSLKWAIFLKNLEIKNNKTRYKYSERNGMGNGRICTPLFPLNKSCSLEGMPNWQGWSSVPGDRKNGNWERAGTPAEPGRSWEWRPGIGLVMDEAGIGARGNRRVGMKLQAR